MKALFAVDHIFGQTPDHQVVTIGGKFPYSAWQSYLDAFGQLTVISRANPSLDTRGQRLSEGPGVDFMLLPARRGLDRLRGMRSTRAIIFDAVARVDVVIARLPSETALLACAAARFHAKPYLVEVVACPWDALWNHGSRIARLYAPFFTHRNRRAIRDAPVARYVTHSFLQGRYPTSGREYVASNVELPPTGVTSVFQAFSDIVQFGTIGALHTRLKGIDIAMRALHALKRERPLLKFRYQVVGEGDPSSLLAIRDSLGLQDEVQFIGTLPPGEAIAQWLAGLDIYLQPSFQEGLPRAVIEALNQGRIVIGSTAGGTPELLRRDRLHRPGDVSSLSRIIGAVLDTPQPQLTEEAQENLRMGRRFSRDIIMAARRDSLQALASMTAAARS